MADFIRFFRQHLRDRGLLLWAVVCALISSISLGVGLIAMIPILKLIFDAENQERGLVGMAERYNLGDHTVLIPLWIVERLPTDQFDGVIVVVVCLAVLTLFGATFNFLHQYFAITLATRTVARIRQTVFDQVLHMPITEVSLHGPSQFVARIIKDATEIQRGIIALTSRSLAAIGKGLAAFVVAIVAGGTLTLLALAVVPLVAFILRKLGKRIRRGSKGALRGQQELLRMATESVQGLRAVKANTGETQALEKFAAMNEHVVQQVLRARLARALSSPLLEVIAIIVVGGLAIYAAKEIIDLRLSREQFLLALGSLAVAGSSLKPLAMLVNEMQAAAAPAERIQEILDHEPEEDRTAAHPDMPRHERSLTFENVSLTYPNQESPALSKVSLSVEFGQRVAIVGPNGSGKTTLLGLVPRLLVPDAGRVLIDEEDVANFNLRSIRVQVGVVTQETVLFRGTIEENIAYGMPSATPEQIAEAARYARAHDFVEALPDGYQTNVLELGASLSGGQRQRLAIARALLRNPSILILDEATSQVDAESEAQINEAIADISKDRTVVLIAHRLATVVDADLIVVLDEGRIVDQGRHDELLERCELYRRLTRTQLVASAS